MIMFLLAFLIDEIFRFNLLKELLIIYSFVFIFKCYSLIFKIS